MQPNTHVQRNRFVALARLGLILALLAAFLPAGASSAAAPAPAGDPLAAPMTSPAELLNPDGTLNLATGVSGTLDLLGWNVTLDAARGPVFQPNDKSSAIPLASDWNPLGTGMNGQVRAIVINGSDMYVGGDFTSAGSCTSGCNRIAKWDGSAWSPLGTGMNGYVSALAFDGSGNLYAGGNFTSAGSCTSGCNYIAKWNGSTWSPLGTGMDGPVWAIATSGSDVYAGGDFTSAGSCTSGCTSIAKWNGSSWSTLNAGTAGMNYVKALTFSGSNLYVGGNFAYLTGCYSGCSNIAKWNGSTWSALGTGTNTNGTVSTIAISGSDVYAGGDFTSAGSCTSGCKYIAKWSGSSWSALGTGMNYSVYALTISGSDVYVGGDFTSAGGCTSGCTRIAKWNGSTWSPLSTGAPNSVYALAISGSDVYAGGNFTRAGSCTSAMGCNRIARWGEPPAPTVCTASQSGNWSDPATWDCDHMPGPGEAVVIPAGFTVTLDQDIELDSDLDVQGTLDPNGKTVTLTGDQPQELSGNLTFHNLTINKTNAADTVTVTSGKLTSSGRTRIRNGKLITASDYEDLEIDEFGTLQLGNDITIGGNLVVTGTLDTHGFGITFDGAKEQNLTLDHVTTFDNLTVAAGATLIETDSGDHAAVVGTLTNNGVIRKTQAIDAATDYYFGLASQGELLIDVTTDNFTSVTVERRDQNHPGRTGTGAPPAAGVGWGIYWSITPDGSGVADLILPHALGSNHANAQACRFVSGTTWDCARSSSDEWTVTRAGVSTFSDWAVGNNVTPTAVTLREFRAAPQFDLAAWLADLLRRLGVAR